MATRKPVQDDEQELEELEEELDGSEPTEDWPDRKQVAMRLGVSQMTVRRLEKSGLLKPHKLPGSRGGKIVFNPDEVMGVNGSDTPTIEEMSSQTLVQASVNLARQSGGHAERLLQLVEEPAAKLLEMALDENKSLRERLRQMEEDRIALFEMMEKARSQEHERQLEQLRWASADERKNVMLKFIVDNGPKLTQQIVASGQAPELLNSITGLAKSLSDEQVGSLMSILNPDQANALGNLLTAAGKQEKPVETTGHQTHSLLQEDMNQ